MSTTRDWLPASREQQLEMADDRISVCTAKYTDWNIPTPALREPTALRDTAGIVLETAKNETTRTPVTTAQCKKDVIEFDFGGSGKTAFFAVQIENEGKKSL
jgi:hypothetical protein